jgi:hypothetical protein
MTEPFFFGFGEEKTSRLKDTPAPVAPDLELEPQPGSGAISKVPSPGTDASDTSAAKGLSPESLRDPEALYALAEERRFAGYVVQLWRREGEGMYFDDVLRFFADGQSPAGGAASEIDVPAIEVRGGVELHPRSGEDMDGDGLPELVIQRYSGGAHCCFSTHVYTLAPVPEPARLLMRTPDSNCPGDFEDLDEDGLPEFVTCDDLMAYARCPYAISPMPKVYLRAEAGLGYLPANDRFAERYAAGIEAKANALQARAANASGEGGGMESLDAGADACEVLDVTLDLLYAGRAAEGWRFLDEHYRGADVDGLRAELEAALAASPYYPHEGEVLIPVKAPEGGG